MAKFSLFCSYMKVWTSLFLLTWTVKSTTEFVDCNGICRCSIKPTETDVNCQEGNLTEIPRNIPTNTTTLYLSKSKISTIKSHAFQHLPELKELYIKDATDLEEVQKDAFSGLDKLEILQIYGCDKLTHIGDGVLHSFASLHTLYIRRSGLTEIPDFSKFNTSYQNLGVMQEIDLSVNRISFVSTGAFSTVKTFRLQLLNGESYQHKRHLENNLISQVEDGAFQGALINKLYFTGNKALVKLGNEAFVGVRKLNTLELSATSIMELPTDGLDDLEELFLEKTPSLRHFPSVVKFEKLTVAKLTYPHHCCAFKNPEIQNPDEWEKYEKLQDAVRAKCATTILPSTEQHTTIGVDQLTVGGEMRGKRSNRKQADFRSTDNWNDLAIDGNEDSMKFGDFSPHELDMNDSLHGFGIFDVHHTPKPLPDDHYGGGGGFGPIIPSDPLNHNFPNEKDSSGKRPGGLYHEGTTIHPNDSHTHINCGKVFRDVRKVVCTPEPDAFNPCEDVMGYEWLRVIVWFVLLAALLGNTVVILVLLSNNSKLSVAKFLMCNLAFADFLMGAYLLILASIDIHTLGEYFNHAIAWQNEGGCQTAGFLTVFSSELSVYTLSVITLERWYAISHAIHLTKRLKMRQACAIMALGWLYAISMAALPLAGVSGYGTVSICLPMEVSNSTDIAYVLTILILNGLAFIVICASYVNMYWRVRGSDSTARSSDATIAKRMALLVFTNFACWAPIAFFGLTASAGMPLIDITNSKVLLVFFYPLNSCANPFLYAILTKQFRRDLFLMLSKYGLCTKQANKYKGAVSSRSIIHSRNNSIALHNMQQNSMDVSVTTQWSECHRGSRVSLGSSTTKTITPSAPPTPTQECSAQSSDKSLLSVLVSHGSERNKDGRKLSTVLEASHVSDEIDHDHITTSDLKSAKTSDGNGEIKHPSRIRSVSDYGFSCQLPKKGKNEVNRKTSQDVSIGSTTDMSVISDSSQGEVLSSIRDSKEECWGQPKELSVSSLQNTIGKINEIKHPTTKGCFVRETISTPLLWNGTQSDESDDGDDEDSEADVKQLVKPKHLNSLRTPIHPIEKCPPLKV